jgi:hypothetical protein
MQGVEKSDLDYAPFDARGGLGRMHEPFGRIDHGLHRMHRFQSSPLRAFHALCGQDSNELNEELTA